MSNIQQEAKGKNDGEIRYLTPLNIDNSAVKKYCRFKKYGINFLSLESGQKRMINICKIIGLNQFHNLLRNLRLVRQL